MLQEHTPLIATIVAGIVLAFIFGTIAQRLRMAPLVGYLLAGVAVGPFTPGFVADAGLAAELAEVGVILLMFGVGLHFNLRGAVGGAEVIAIPGAVGQITVATLLGLLACPAWRGCRRPRGSSFTASPFPWRARSCSSACWSTTTGARHAAGGDIAVGWLIVEDLAMVLTLVLLPRGDAAPARGHRGEALSSAGGIVVRDRGNDREGRRAFVAVMLVAGRRAIPWLLHYVAHTGSRELFRLAVLAIALGVALRGGACSSACPSRSALFLPEWSWANPNSASSAAQRRAAAPRCLCRAVLRFRGNAVRARRSSCAEPWPLLATAAHHRCRQVARRLRHRARVRISDPASH